MSKYSRVLKTGKNQITCPYGNGHVGVDVVKYKGQTDYIIAHSDGEVVSVVKNYNKTDTKGNSYGNYVKIKHSNGYYTLYAHMKYGTVTVNVGSKVKKGQTIGYMGNTGYSKGAHLHFEVWKGSKRIDPTPYLDKDLPNTKVIYYRTRYSGKFRETKMNGQQSGNGKSWISCYQVKSNLGTVYYCSHLMDTDKWLTEVSKWDDTPNGFAGIAGKKSDLFMAKLVDSSGKIIPIRYRIMTKRYGWHPWVTGYNKKDANNGYAGLKGNEILALEIELL